jgi:hypothetical protein
MVKLAPKEGFAEVPDDVLEKIKELRIEGARKIAYRINELKLQIGTAGSSWHADQYRAEMTGLVAQFEQLKKTGGGSVIDGARRGGMADVRMRMRRLPFEKFYLKERSLASGDQTWMIGLTKQIITTIEGMHIGKHNARVGTTDYDMGKYFIAILCNAIGSSQPTFHLLPQSNPTTSARHMHHHVSDYRGGKTGTNPLDWAPANCYGSFHGPIHGSFQNADIPELFRMLYLFTKTLNPASPLLQLSALPHIHEVKK